MPDNTPETKQIISEPQTVSAEKLFTKLVDHYYGEREGPGRGLEDARRRAVEKLLLSPNLDVLGVPRVHKEEPLTKETVASCQRVVEYLAEEIPEALSGWAASHGDDIQQFFDSGDVRIGVILKLAKKRLERRERDGEDV